MGVLLDKRFRMACYLVMAWGALMILTASLIMSAMPSPIPPCRFEDGSGQDGLCYWDAATMGNRKGHGVRVYRDGVYQPEYKIG